MAKPLAPTSRYRYGKRDAIARVEHARQSREWRRDLADQEFDWATRRAFIKALRQRRNLIDAARDVGVTLSMVYGRMRWDSHFADAVERVLTHLCRNNERCGQWDGYRNGGRCKRCRKAKRTGRTER